MDKRWLWLAWTGTSAICWDMIGYRLPCFRVGNRLFSKVLNRSNEGAGFRLGMEGFIFLGNNWYLPHRQTIYLVWY